MGLYSTSDAWPRDDHAIVQSLMNHEGTLHALRLGPDPATGEDRYSITYAPYSRRGGALPPYVAGSDDDLRRLLREIGVEESRIDALGSELKSSGRASLPNVVLSGEQLKRYGLAEMSILESVISYLST